MLMNGWLDFTQSKSNWECTVCPKAWPMNKHAAVKHENTTQHTENIPTTASWGVTDTNSWDPSPGWNDLAWTTPMPARAEDDESRFFLCHLPDFIPFWMRGVEAAEQGETLRYEEYLEQVDKVARKEWKTWRSAMDGVRPAESSKTAAESLRNGWEVDRDNQGWGESGVVDSWGNTNGAGWDDVGQDTGSVDEAAVACPGHVLVDRVARSASPEKTQQLH